MATKTAAKKKTAPKATLTRDQVLTIMAKTGACERTVRRIIEEGKRSRSPSTERAILAAYERICK
jgi:hypothetical protein